MNPTEPLEASTRLQHIVEAATEIVDFMGDRSFAEYQSDRMLRLAIERLLIIVGEALNRAIKAEPSVVNSITETPGIIAVRNRLIHDYPHISDERIWEIATYDVPRLLSEVRALLSAAGQNPA